MFFFTIEILNFSTTFYMVVFTAFLSKTQLKKNESNARKIAKPRWVISTLSVAIEIS